MSALTLTNTMPYWMPVLMVGAMYRRIRGNLGVQPWRPVRAWIRLGFVALILLMMLLALIVMPAMRLGTGVGLLIGALLAALNLKHTHVAWTNGVKTYTPNPWIGGVLSALLVGRLFWRMGNGGLQTQPALSGLTFGIATTMLAYSTIYIAGLMLQIRRLPPQPEAST